MSRKSKVKINQKILVEIDNETRYLTYLGDTGERSGTDIIGKWKCFCGKNFHCKNHSIIKNSTKSCGCFALSKIKNPEEIYLHRLHNSIIQKCYNFNNKFYPNYGGRGISIQEDWRYDRKKFISDLLDKLGHRPDETYSLDRINNDSSYEINNLRWSNKVDQNNNKSTNIKITIKDIEKTISEWSREMNISSKLTSQRLLAGKSGEDLIKPVPRKKEKLFNPVDFKSIWASIKTRCYNPNSQAYLNYGGREIQIYNPWKNDYKQFQLDIIKEIGERPSSDYQLDRINNDGNYEPGNLRWATSKENQRNKSNNIIICYNGEFKNLSEWAEILNLDAGLISRRLDAGWAIEEITTTQKQGRKFSKEMVDKIREEHKTNTIAKLANQYQVDRRTIRDIIRHRGAYKD